MASTSHPTFGTLLKRYRVAAGLTQEALAEQANLSVRAISDLERGLKTTPRRDTVELLADALELSEEDRAALGAMVFRRPGPSPSYLPSESSLAGAESPPLVGRSTELTALERHLGGAGPPVLLLAGEPGIGKTRLLQETCRRAELQGLSVIQGGCQRRRGQEPYAPLLEALARHVRNLARAQLLAALRDCVWLVGLLPELAQTLGEPLPALAPEQERRLMFGSVARFLARTAGPAGTLLVLDDLQWAGADALDLLSTLAESAGELPLRIVGAYRDTELSTRDPFAATLADLARAGLAAELAVGQLTPQEAELLLESLLEEREGAELKRGILQRVGGVPFYLISYAQALRSRDRESAPEAVVPWDLKQSLRQRVAALAEEGQVVLAAAAVIGRIVRYELLARAVDQPEEQVLAGVEAACRARLLVEETEQTYRFAHDVIREGVEADLGAARRAALHRRIAEALAGLPGEPSVEALERVRESRAAEVAWHFLQGGDRERALRWSLVAGDQAERVFAHAEAEQHYRTALELAEESGDELREGEVREKLGGVLMVAGRYDEALEDLEAAAKSYHAARDLAGEARVVATLGDVHRLRATPQEGIARVQRMLESLLVNNGDAALRYGATRLSVALAWLFFVTGRFREALPVAERAADLARRLKEQLAAARVLVEAEQIRATALLQVEDPRGHQVLEDLVLLAEEAGHLPVLRDTLHLLAVSLLRAGQTERAVRCAERSLELAERTEDPATFNYVAAVLAFCLFFLGDWPTARTRVAPVLAPSPSLHGSWAAAYPLMVLGLIDMAEGRVEEGEKHLQWSIAIAEPIWDLLVLRLAHAALAEWQILQGQPAQARARLEPLALEPGVQLAVMLPVLAEACLAMGDAEQAEAVAGRALERTHHGTPVAVPDALRVQALVRARQGRWEEAEAALAEAVSLARAMPYPYAEARALYEWGQIESQKGELEQARERLEEALAISRRLGARPYMERTKQALAALDRVH